MTLNQTPLQVGFFVFILKFLVFLYENLSLWLFFAIIFNAMAVPDRVSSIIKPRYLTIVFYSIRFPSQITFNFSQLFNFLFVPNNIGSVFPI